MKEPAELYVALDDLKHLLEQGDSVTLVDARTPGELAESHVPGAINVPMEDLIEFARSHGTASARLMVTMCGSAGRGERAAAILARQGVENVRVLEGGLRAWRDANLPVA